MPLWDAIAYGYIQCHACMTSSLQCIWIFQLFRDAVPRRSYAGVVPPKLRAWHVVVLNSVARPSADFAWGFTATVTGGGQCFKLIWPPSPYRVHRGPISIAAL